MMIRDIILNNYELEERDYSSLLYIRIFCFSPILNTKITKIYFSTDTILDYVIGIINQWTTKDTIIVAITSSNTLEIIRKPYKYNKLMFDKEKYITFEHNIHIIHNAIPDKLYTYLKQYNS